MMLFLQVSLVHADHRPVVVVGRERQMSPIVGVTTSTMHRITLPNTPEWHRTSGQLTGVFAFTDLSIRQEGAYRLKFDLFELVNGEAVFRTLIYSDEFKVYPAKSFPGMAQSTDFTDVLKKHGIRVRVSKSVRNNGKKDAGNMGVGLPASKFHPDNGYMTQRGRHDHVNPRPTPYNPHSSRVLPLFYERWLTVFSVTARNVKGLRVGNSRTRLLLDKACFHPQTMRFRLPRVPVPCMMPVLHTTHNLPATITIKDGLASPCIIFNRLITVVPTWTPGVTVTLTITVIVNRHLRTK